MKPLKDLISIVLITVAITGCKFKNKYYYKENGREEVVIEEYSDSAAYMQAFQKFEISKKVNNDMKEAFGSSTRETPTSFVLYDSKHIDITYKIQISNKDSLENENSKSINSQPNNIKQMVDKNMEEKNGVGSKYDTAGLYLSPIKVVSARFITKEYSNYKDIRLSFKNVSEKKISAIRFKWYGENSFNEPANMGGLRDGWGGGFTDDALRPGGTDEATWDILSKDGKKILIAYPYEIAFVDGTKWELGK